VKKAGGDWRREQRAKRFADEMDTTALRMSPEDARRTLAAWAAPARAYAGGSRRDEPEGARCILMISGSVAPMLSGRHIGIYRVRLTRIISGCDLDDAFEREMLLARRAMADWRAARAIMVCYAS
jgi:hypothetical protein